MYINHTNALNINYTRVWKKTRIALLIIKKKPRELQPAVPTQHHPLGKKSLFHLIQSLDHPTYTDVTSRN